MRHDRALKLAERIRRVSPGARVLVMSGRKGKSALFVAIDGRTARIDRIADWRDHFEPGTAPREWRAREAIGA